MGIGIRNSRGLKRVSARTQGLVAAMAAAGLLTLAGPALASLPQGHEVRAGQVVPEVVGNTMTIRQTSQAAKLDWKRFDIGQDHAVRIEQPNREALLVNRVTGSTLSQIDGSLTANGRVYLLNPNGITFGPTAKVDVGGLVAAAMLASDDALMRAPTTLDLSGNGSAGVANQGEIKIAKGGVTTLAAPGVVAQSGQVTAPEGAIHLASAERMTIDDQGRIKQVDGERREVKHAGTTSANDGEVKIYGGERDVIGGVVEAKGRGRIELAGTDSLWDLSGEIRPGGALLLSEVVFQVHEPTGSGTLSHKRLAQWLNDGADVEIRRRDENIYAGGDIEVKPDASGRLTFSTEGDLVLARIEVPRLTIQTPVRVGFDARDKDFDGSTRAEVDGLDMKGVSSYGGIHLRLLPTFAFDSLDPGESLVSAKVFLTGYHGDEKHELRVIHDESPEGLKRRTATIFPKVDPVPMPDPDGKPGLKPEPIPIPEPQPRPTPTPDVTPRPDPSPVSPDRIALPSRALAAIACEERREPDPRAICDDLADPPPASSPPSLELRGIRLPADARPRR